MKTRRSVARTTRMFGSIVPGYYSREEIQRLQDYVQRKAIIIDAAATVCTALDQATLTAWRLQGYVPAMSYAAQDVPFAVDVPGLSAMHDAGLQLEATLDSWAQKLRDDGCNVQSIPMENPLERVVTAAKWVGGGALLLAGLVAVIKIADVVDDAERMV